MNSRQIRLRQSADKQNGQNTETEPAPVAEAVAVAVAVAETVAGAKMRERVSPANEHTYTMRKNVLN